MLLAVDVGNTQTVFGLYEGSDLGERWRIATEEQRTGAAASTASRARNRALAGRLRAWHDEDTGVGAQLDDPIWKDLLGGLAKLAGWLSDFWPL